MEEAGVGGPIFISIGDANKLNTFLDANDWMSRDKMFVDDYSFDAYKAAGFGRFDQVDKDAVKNVKMSAPTLKFGDWIKYFSVVGKVSPVPKVMWNSYILNHYDAVHCSDNSAHFPFFLM